MIIICKGRSCRFKGLVALIAALPFILWLSRKFSSIHTTTKEGKSINIRYYSNSKHNDAAFISPTFDRYVFLKVHKTGSSTAQNIFLRFGLSLNLTFLLPKIRNGKYDSTISPYYKVSSKDIEPAPPNKSYDISCCHVNYGRKEFDNLFHGNVAYIGIVREPFSQFSSSLQYVRPSYIFGPNKIIGNEFCNKTSKTILNFLLEPWKYEDYRRLERSWTNNRMALEFDFPRFLFQNYSKADSTKYLQRLEKEFVFVIIMEYFDESVVVMRRKLNWSHKDIMYIKKNVAKIRCYYEESYKVLYKKIAKLDYDLYNFFNESLWNDVIKLGSDFYEELHYFQELNAKIENFCKQNQRPSYVYVIDATKWSKAFVVTSQDCLHMIMNEGDFVLKVKEMQYPTMNISVKK